MSKRSFTVFWVLSVSAAILFAGCHTQKLGGKKSFTLQPGDLLFQDLDSGSLCDAIEKVTTGYEGANLSHVGIVVKLEDGQIVVVEAIGSGVDTVPVQQFLERSLDENRQPKILVGRVKPAFSYLIPTVTRHALSLRGKPYDKVFDSSNDAYYCSELIYYSFMKANGGKPVFEMQPMTFIDPDTGETFGAWKEYFRELGVPVPEGKPGINPGSISRSKVLTIVHAYGLPGGWKSRKLLQQETNRNISRKSIQATPE